MMPRHSMSGGWPRALIADVAIKGGLFAILVVAVLNPDLKQFEGKAMAGRAVAYPLAVMVVPAGWWLFFRGSAFPATVDALISLPFLIDTAGNALDLYDSVSWWDDANHVVNWAILTAGLAVAIRGLRLPAWNAIALGVGFGAVTAVGWEFVEYWTFIRDSPELETAYEDTLGDLTLGLTGSVVAAVAVGLIPARPGKG